MHSPGVKIISLGCIHSAVRAPRIVLAICLFVVFVLFLRFCSIVALDVPYRFSRKTQQTTTCATYKHSCIINDGDFEADSCAQTISVATRMRRQVQSGLRAGSETGGSTSKTFDQTTFASLDPLRTFSWPACNKPADFRWVGPCVCVCFRGLERKREREREGEGGNKNKKTKQTKRKKERRKERERERQKERARESERKG